MLTPSNWRELAVREKKNPEEDIPFAFQRNALAFSLNLIFILNSSNKPREKHTRSHMEIWMWNATQNNSKVLMFVSVSDDGDPWTYVTLVCLTLIKCNCSCSWMGQSRDFGKLALAPSKLVSALLSRGNISSGHLGAGSLRDVKNLALHQP